ncbi:MAG: hypothetical protein ACRCW4_11415, partial [Candidatus Neomicrothrix subdominans]
MATNLAPGPALFFGWLATQHGWPLTVVVYRSAYEGAPPEWRVLQLQVLEAADRVLDTGSVAERDQTVLSLGEELTLERLGLR